MARRFSWKGRRALVTGAGGFVGRWLSRVLLARGARVLCLVLPREVDGLVARELRAAGGRVLTGRVESASLLRRALADGKTEAVFHLAALNVNFGADVSPVPVFETNLRGTWQLLEACRRTPSVRRVVLASSIEVEGVACAPGPSRNVLPMHPYRVSKLAAELVARTFADGCGLPVAVARSANLYGGGDLNWQRLIPGTILALGRGERPVLRSDGRGRRDYLYVEDVVDAYLAAAAALDDSSARGRVFHFTTGVSTSALEIVSRLCALMGRADLEPVVLNESPHERTDRRRSSSGALRALGWRSRTGLARGLRETVRWYRAHFESLGRGPC